MATNTFDTSRVGGGTYELEQDANGNYKLKSVGFQQINKLTLPDLKSSDPTEGPKILPVEDEKKVDDPYKKLFKQTEGGGGGGGQDYSGVMLKTPEVKEATVRDAGEMTNTTYNQMTDAEKEAVATGTSGMVFRGAGDATKQYTDPQKYGISRTDTDRMDIREQARVGNFAKDEAGFSGPAVTMEGPYSMSTAKTYKTPRTIADQNKYLGRTFTEKATGLQKIKSKASDAVGKVKDSSLVQKLSKFSPIRIAGNILGAVLPKFESSPTQTHAKSYFNVRGGNVDGNRIAGNPATDLYAGMNRTSDFGNLEKAGDKRLATRQKTIERKGYKPGDKFYDDTEKMKKQATNYKASKQKATQGPAGGATTGGGGGDKGSDSGRVICTDLHRTGELSTRDWIRDTKFTFKTLSKTHVKGYLFWAEPTVRHIQKYPRYRKIWKHIAQHRANDIAWRLNEGKFDLLGRIYAGIGEPVCWMLGNFVSDKQISKYNLTHWRRV